MSDDLNISIALGLSLSIFFMVIVRRGALDPLLLQILFYIFFAFGPVINYLRGEAIYVGIKQMYIPTASWIFFSAVLAMCIPAWLIPLNSNVFRDRVQSLNVLSPILRPANIVMGMVSLLLILKLVIIGRIGIDKIQAISIIGRIHYPYLLIQLYLTAFYFNVGNTSWDRNFYFLNFFLWIFYCLVMGERDFVFTLISIGLHWFISKPQKKGQTLRFVLSALALGLLATGLFLFRDSTQNFGDPLTSFLGQGSLLFVNTFTLFLLETKVDYFLGDSYMLALGNLAPSWIYSTGFNLPEWLRFNYAPGSSSGYGFGLDAEGFLNFSWAGVFLTFLFLGLFQRWVFNSKRFSEFFIFFSVFSTGFTMYSFRNDSTAFLKGNIYAMISFLVLYFLSRLISFRHRGVS